MSEMFPVQVVLSAEWVSIATRTDCLRMADFLPKSAIFRTLRSGSGVAVSTVQGRIVVRMAELLMNSAIPSEGSMQTSWPALRNSCCANLGDS